MEVCQGFCDSSMTRIERFQVVDRDKPSSSFSSPLRESPVEFFQSSRPRFAKLGYLILQNETFGHKDISEGRARARGGRSRMHKRRRAKAKRTTLPSWPQTTPTLISATSLRLSTPSSTLYTNSAASRLAAGYRRLNSSPEITSRDKI